MCIGIIYDAYTNDSWYKIDKDIYSVKLALRAVRLPLPIAGIFDTVTGDFAELNAEYRGYRPELMVKVTAALISQRKEMKAAEADLACI